MEKKTSNRSLFLYTALIFAAALAVIAISFSAQINAEKNREQYIGEENEENSIAGKISALSDENRILLETTNSLNQKINELSEDNQTLTDNVLSLDKKMENAKRMYIVFDKIEAKDFDGAVEEYQTIEPLFFTEEQDSFYNYLTQQLTDYLPKEEAAQ